MQKALSQLAKLTCTLIIFQYLMNFDHGNVDPLQKLGEWRSLITEGFCHDPMCQQDWGEWLSIINVPKSFIILDFMLLAITVVVINYSNIKESLNSLPQIGDSSDFMKQNLTVKHFLNRTIFKGFIYLFTGYIFIISMTGIGDCDLISVGYLVFSIVMIAKFRKIHKDEDKTLKHLKIYNFTVLTSIILF